MSSQKPDSDQVVHDSSYGFTVMFVLIVLQLVYAIGMKAWVAIWLDAALLPGSMIIVADYFNQWWLLDVQMLLLILGEFYVIIRLRDLQDTGTHPLL